MTSSLSVSLPRTRRAQLRYLLGLYAIGFTFWVVLVVWREVQQRDAQWMRRTYVPGVPVVGDVNGRALGHFLHYLCLGFFAPDLWPWAALAGFAFELSEIPMGRFLSSYVDSKIVEDTVTNSTGLLLGVLLRRCCFS